MTARTAAGTALIAVLGLSAVYGGDFFGLRDRVPPPAERTEAPAFGTARANDPASGRVARRSQPYWRELRRFSGRGPAVTPAFTIADRALQWRVAWRCERGSLRIQPRRPDGKDHGHALADGARCPDEGRGLSVAHGGFRLGVAAAGPWTAVVEQQVDDPLVEPRTAVMRRPDTERIARSRFYGIDEEGSGILEVHRAADGTVEVRLEDFYVTPNVDLELRLSELPRPRTTKDVVRARHRDVGFLDATAGSMNYRLPRGALTPQVRSIVIWCEITHNAYAAASLDG